MSTNISKPRSALLASFVCSLLLTATGAPAAEQVKDAKPEPSRAELQQKLEAAQKKLDSAAREVADLSMSLSGDVMPRTARLHSMHPPRAVLGMVIGGANNSRRTDGVEILSVSPGGGAAEAGLKSGDVVTEINGKPLKGTAEDPPERQFLSAMREVDPGQKVALKYLRDGKTASATVEARESQDRFFSFAVPPAMGAMPAMPAMPFAKFAFTRADGVFGSAQLVSLTPKLGQYFGSEKGLLVVRAPSDARLKLEEGDVIVDIDGRVPSSPSHAFQILSSYQSGEKLKLNVLRMKKKLSFDVTIPEDAEGWDRSGPGERGNVFMRQGEVGTMPPAPPMPVDPIVHEEIRLVAPEREPQAL
jgi:type II secretory pathway component PulC